MKLSIFADRSRRSRLFGSITVAAILLLFLLNLVLTHFGIFGTAFLDMTPEGLYTLTDRMAEECAFLDELKNDDGSRAEVGMIFCNDPDKLIAAEDTRVTYYMALALRQKYPGFKVSTVNVSLDPTAVAAYRTTSLTEIAPTDIILTYKGKYRVVTADSFWLTGSAGHYSYNGEYRLASLLLSLTAYRQPVAYFLTGHGETAYDPADPTSPASAACGTLVDLLADQGMRPALLDLSTVDAVPEDCALLIINNPQTDFDSDPGRYREFGYLSDTDKIERYLVADAGSLLVDKDYRISLPNLEDLLAEWGIAFIDANMRQEATDGSGLESTRVVAAYNTDEGSYGYSIYKEYADLSTSPRCVIPDTGAVECSYDGSQGRPESGTFNTTVMYSPFLKADASLYAKNGETGEYSVLIGSERVGERHLAAVSARMATDAENGNRRYSYIFAAASGSLFSNDLLGNPSLANYEIFSALINNLVRSDRYADDALGGTSFNSDAFAGKILVSQKIYDETATETDGFYPLTDGERTAIAIVLAAVPLAVLAVGTVLAVRRKFL